MAMKQAIGKSSENRIVVCAVWTAAFAACMAVMLLFAARKAIVIADVSRDSSGLPVNAVRPGGENHKALLLEESRDMERTLFIPLPKESKAEQVTMENRYMDRELLVYIQDGKERFFEKNKINGDISSVMSAWCEAQDEGVLLKIRMDRVLEYKSTMDSSGLTITWYEPEELYDYIAVVDPAGGGRETGISGYGLPEKDVTLQVARQIQKQSSFENIRLYYTRTEDVEISDSERQRFAEEVGADFYIRLRADADEADTDVYGVTGFYNEDYYIPDFGSTQLADILTREVAAAAANRAVGLKEAARESVLRGLTMPAAEISVGFLSNPKEAYLLAQEAYQEKLAAGLVSAVSGALEELESIRAEFYAKYGDER